MPRDHEIWVAEEDGRVVGFAAIGDDTLGHIYVHPDYQGRGIGIALLEQGEGAAPGRLHALDVPAERARLPLLRAARAARVRLTDGSGNEEGCPTCSTSGRALALRERPLL